MNNEEMGHHAICHVLLAQLSLTNSFQGLLDEAQFVLHKKDLQSYILGSHVMTKIYIFI